MPRDKRELSAWWNKEDDDIWAHGVRSPDAGLTLTALMSNPVHGPSILRPGEDPVPPFLLELERCGYDITTFKMSVQHPEEHAWVRCGAFLYPKGGGRPVEVDWIRRRGRETRVFLAFGQPASESRPATQLSSMYRCAEGLSLADVERMYQPHPPEQPDWSPDELPPMFPTPRKS